MDLQNIIPSGYRGFEFWEKTLKRARLVVAPMVDASELAWRMLSRKYGAELCYTPMLHSSVFVKDARYRKDNLISCDEDRPLIVQFCSNDPETFVKACVLASPHCDAIDLNLGCPQTIAKKGHYGAFLMEEWDLISNIIRRATQEVDIAITTKIRIYSDIETTVKYALMLQSAGVSLLTVHGRTRDQKGAMTGVADWKYIRAVREAVQIPIFANGNIQYLSDIENCLSFTGAHGMMTAEGNLHNPALFTGNSPFVWDMVLEYLAFVKLYPCPLSYSRGHVFKMLHHCFNMPENFELRYDMSKCSNVDAMIVVADKLKQKMIDYSTQKKMWEVPQDGPLSNLRHPPWLCQPYVRIPAEEHMKKIAVAQKRALERQEEDIANPVAKRENPEGHRVLSKKKLKRLRKNPHKKYDQPVQEYERCSCKNPRGSKCEHLLCRCCCKFKCHLEDLECKSHRINCKKESRQQQFDKSSEKELSENQIERAIRKNLNDGAHANVKETATNNISQFEQDFLRPKFNLNITNTAESLNSQGITDNP